MGGLVESLSDEWGVTGLEYPLGEVPRGPGSVDWGWQSGGRSSANCDSSHLSAYLVKTTVTMQYCNAQPELVHLLTARTVGWGRALLQWAWEEWRSPASADFEAVGF